MNVEKIDLEFFILIFTGITAIATAILAYYAYKKEHKYKDFIRPK